MPTGLTANRKLKPINSEEPADDGRPMTAGEATYNIVNRLLRTTGAAERVGVSNILNQLEIAPIPLGAVIPLCNSLTKAAILDSERIAQGIPLVYIWTEIYLLATKGSKKFAFMVKELASDQLSSEIKDTAGGEEGE